MNATKRPTLTLKSSNRRNSASVSPKEEAAVSKPIPQKVGSTKKPKLVKAQDSANQQQPKVGLSKKKAQKLYKKRMIDQVWVWTAEKWPDIFSKDTYAQPRLLAIGIRDHIMAEYQSLGGKDALGFTPSHIKMFLSFWVRNEAYRAATQQGARRYSLNGEIAGEVTSGEEEGVRQLQEKGREKKNKGTTE